MITELYRITDVPSDELAALIEDGNNALLRESLGLPPLELKSSTPFRYRFITDEEKKVFRVLFPKRTNLKSYTGFVPNEVLEAMQEVKSTCPYRMAEQPYIMSPLEYDPDPVLVCPVRTENDQYNFVNREILVARWGDALLPFEQLRVKAVTLWKSRREQVLKKLHRELTNAIEDLANLQEITETDTPVMYHV